MAHIDYLQMTEQQKLKFKEKEFMQSIGYLHCDCCGKNETLDKLSRYHNLNFNICDDCLRKLLK